MFGWAFEESGTLTPSGVLYFVGCAAFIVFGLVMAAAVTLSAVMGWPI